MRLKHGNEVDKPVIELRVAVRNIIAVSHRIASQASNRPPIPNHHAVIARIRAATAYSRAGITRNRTSNQSNRTPAPIIGAFSGVLQNTSCPQDY